MGKIFLQRSGCQMLRRDGTREDWESVAADVHRQDQVWCVGRTSVDPWCWRGVRRTVRKEADDPGCVSLVRSLTLNADTRRSKNFKTS